MCGTAVLAVLPGGHRFAPNFGCASTRLCSAAVSLPSTVAAPSSLPPPHPSMPSRACAPAARPMTSPSAAGAATSSASTSTHSCPPSPHPASTSAPPGFSQLHCLIPHCQGVHPPRGLRRPHPHLPSGLRLNRLRQRHQARREAGAAALACFDGD
jgi:hypothetical protein